MSFINSIFLFATAAAVLPILYHLVRRMKARTVPFGSLMFLKATPKELIRKRRLRDRLLMAARAAIFLLLALAFARPYLPADQIPFVPQRQDESVVLLVDRSMSMRYAGAFERALDAVRARLDAAAPNDEVAIVAFSDEAQILSSLESDMTVHRGAVNALEVGYRSTDYFPALQRAQDLLGEARHDRRVVVLISDFQESGWTGALDNWELPGGIVFEPEPVGSAEADNAYVEEFQLTARRSGERSSVRYDARIAALGDAANRERTAALILEGSEADRRALPGRTSTPVSFQQVAPREGFYQGSLILDADDLPFDDRYYFTDRVDAVPSLLVVDAASANARRDAFYLRNAFDLGEASVYRYAQADQPLAASLRQSDIVFMANRAAAGDGERSMLRRYVENGGTLIVSCGDGADPELLSSMLQTLGVGRIDQIVDIREEQDYEAIIGDVDLRHPIFEPFAGGTAGAIFRPTFRRYARLIPDAGATVIGRYDNGDVFLAERSLGGGRVLFYSSTFNTSWTDLPIDEMYVPFLYQLVRYGARRADEQLVFTVGETVAISGSPGDTWEVRDPENRLFRVTMDDEGRGFFREAAVPGHYVAEGGGGMLFFSVNVDPFESDLRARDPEEVYASVVGPPEDVPSTPQQAAVAAVEDEERRQKLWRILILAVVTLFAVESYFANRRSSRGGNSESERPRTRTARKERLPV